jgi:hypothetical protein
LLTTSSSDVPGLLELLLELQFMFRRYVLKHLATAVRQLDYELACHVDHSSRQRIVT